MPSLDREATTYWRSLEAFEAQLESDPELRAFVESEFPEQAADLLDPLSRRRFIQLMGASVALAGVAGAGCQRWEREEIVALSERPEGYTPGEAQQYATAMELGGVADGLLVTAYDGRPVKVEGNPQHPFSGGASTSFAQASVLGLYDPDRSMSVRRKDGAASWDELASLVRGEIATGDGAGLRILSEASSSPTLTRLRGELLARYPNARWYEYEPLAADSERLGLEMAGMVPDGVAGLRAIPLLDKAKRIVALEADLFSLHPARLRFARDFARGRQTDQVLSSSPEQALNRLYAVESTFTTTGATADHRLPLPASHMLAFVDVLGVAFQGMGRMRNARVGDMQQIIEMSVKSLGEQRDKADGAASLKVFSDKALRFIAGLAADLLEHTRESVIVAGPELPPEVHARVAMMNAVLIANGNVLEYRALPESRPGHLQDIMALSQEMQAGQVETLVVLGGNPAYTAPADAGFAEALAKVKTSIHLSEYYDETSAACTWHLPRTHYLESWGDCRSYDGTCSVVQPLIEPMWRDEKNRPGKSPIELVAMLLGRGDVSGQLLVRETFDRAFGGGLGDAAWRKALHDGFIEGSAFPVQAPRPPRKLDVPAPAPIPAGQVEVVFRPSTHTFDGRFANSGWLQETPDFITKLTWDNAALINPNTAEHLGLRNGDMVELQVEGRSVQVPVYTLPGQARGSVAVALGHGRTRAGRVGGSVDEKVAPAGFDVYGLRTSTAAYALTGVAARGTGARYKLATTQDHWNMDSVGREGIESRLGMLIREADADEYKQDPEVIAHREHVPEAPKGVAVPPENGNTLWKLHEYDQPRAQGEVERYRHSWGMAIDLNKCTGCNSCMLACQAENNVPIVGKEQVMKSREMHWIRIDRYFSAGSRDDLRDEPHIAYQPVACQHCEMAPCEQVCPVGATIHSEEGLNDMVYNRCVGTRYCLNNCPYKVRRFNFLDYLNRPQTPGGSLADARNMVRKLIFNPEVTVRSRGVMEKCTFCVQRIQQAKIVAKNDGREQVRDGEVLTACQQACPTGAIVFGDLNDPDSAVRKAHEQPRAYALLAGFYTRPRNLFLGRIRNPNPYLG